MSTTLLADVAVKATLYLGLLFAVAGLLRRTPAAVRHLLWSAGLFVLVGLPVLSVVIPWRLKILPAVEEVEIPAMRDAGTPTPAPKEDLLPETHEQKRKDLTRRASLETAAAPTRSPPSGPRSPAGRSLLDRREWLLLPNLLGLLWLVGGLAVLGHLAAGWITIARIVRGGRELAEPAWRELLGLSVNRMGLATHVRLVESERAPVPFGAGIVHPVIVLPSTAHDWGRDRRRAVMLHEIAHLQRGDAISQLVSQLACAVFWFHPLVWIAARRLRAESERACDDLVLRAGTRPSEYVAHLIEIVRGAGRSWALAVAQPVARRSEFEGRVLAILEPGLKRHGLTPSTACLVLLAIAVTAIPVAAMGPRSLTDSVEHAAAGPAAVQQESPDRVAALVGAIDDVDIGVRVTVAKALGSLQDTAAVAALMRALREDSDSEVRQAAAWSLGQIEDARAIPALGEALRQDEVAGVRQTAAWALAEIQDARAVSMLGEALRSDAEPGVRAQSARALGEIGHGSGVEALSDALTDEDVEVRRTAIWALGEIQDSRAVDPLSSLLRDPDVEVRRRAVRALGEIQSRQAVSPLLEALGDADANVRGLAAWALGEIQDPAAVEGLAAALGDGEVGVRRQAARALGELDLGSAPPSLIAALQDEDVQVQRFAVRALGEIADPASVPGLAGIVRGADSQTRRLAIRALAEIHDPAAYEVLVSALQDEDPEVRKAAARALGRKDGW